jgi:nucleotide-binding universal stress UspA family protein
LNTILCPVDFSAATPFGLAPAAALAERCGAGVVLLHVMDLPSPQFSVEVEGFDLQEFLAERREEARARLEDLARRSFAGAASTRCVVESGAPAAAIVELATAEAAGLVVLPTHSRRGLDRLILGSVAEKVVRLAACPVLTTHPGRDATTVPEFRLGKIVFATDFSDHAGATLASALSLAGIAGAALIMVHVVSEPEFDPAIPAWSRPQVPSSFAAAHLERAQVRLEELADTARESGAEVTTTVHKGVDIARAIVHTAEQEGADLIVLATRGHTGITHLLLGSTAERVVRYADCAVWTERQPR